MLIALSQPCTANLLSNNNNNEWLVSICIPGKILQSREFPISLLRTTSLLVKLWDPRPMPYKILSLSYQYK